MGMDSYIFKTTREKHAAFMTAVAKREAALEKYQDTIDGNRSKLMKLSKRLMRKYPEFEKTPDRKVLCKIATQHEVQEVDDLNDEYVQLMAKCNPEIDPDPGEQLAYWRKPFGLHAYIVRHVHTGGDDNCVRIPLSRDNITDMCNEMLYAANHWNEPNPGDFSSHFSPGSSNWTLETLNDAINKFEDILKHYDDTKDQVYYWAWY